MAIGTSAGFTLYEDEFHSGIAEVQARNTNVFNQFSNNALVLDADLHIGNYLKETFFDDDDLVEERDPTSTSDATPRSMAQSELVGVKLHRRVHVEQTMDSFRKLGMDERVMSLVLGRQFAKRYAARQVSDAIRAISAATKSAMEVNTTAITTTLRTTDLTQGLAKFGDMFANVAAWLTHSKAYFDLLQQQIDSHNQMELARGILVFGGSPATFNRPVIVVDDPLLIDAAGGTGASSGQDLYHTYALTTGAAEIVESETSALLFEPVGGKNNILQRFQWEGAYTVKVKGTAYDTASGGANPSAATLATAGNWDVVASDNKNTAAARLITL